MFNFNLPLRVAQTILAVTAIGLNAYITHWYLTHTHPRSSPNSTTHLIVVAALTLPILPYLFFNPALSHRTASRFFNKYLVLSLDFILCALWAAGFISLAVFYHGLHICAGHVCNIMMGGVMVGVVTCASFLATTVLATLHVVRTRAGPADKKEAHEQWIGQMEAVKV